MGQEHALQQLRLPVEKLWPVLEKTGPRKARTGADPIKMIRFQRKRKKKSFGHPGKKTEILMMTTAGSAVTEDMETYFTCSGKKDVSRVGVQSNWGPVGRWPIF